MNLELLSASPYAGETLECRYSWYGLLRDHDPVHIFHHPTDSRLDLALITRYDDVVAGLRDERLIREAGLPRYIGPPRSATSAVPFTEVFRHWMVYRDPPYHQRLRGPMHTALNQQLEVLRQMIESVVTDLLYQVAEEAKDGIVDLIPTLAFGVPATVVCQLVGLTPDLTVFKRWMSGFSEALERSDDPIAWDEADRVALEMHHALTDAIRRPRTDFMARLMAGIGNHSQIAHSELVANLMLLLFGGHETTLNLIANTIFCLLAHPDVLAHVRADLALVPAVVDEALRFESPVQMTYRFAAVEFTFAGVPIPAKTRVALVLASANRDERAFLNADAFTLQPRQRPHLAFGYGAHFCIGASLGRLEAIIAIQRLLARFPNLELAVAHPRWKQSMTYRAMTSLRVRLY